MNLQSNAAAPCSSTSLLPASHQLQMCVQQLLPSPPPPAACEKLQETCQRDSTLAGSHFMDSPTKFPTKLPFPTFKPYSNKTGVGIGLSTDNLSSTSNTIFPPEKPFPSYLSPNKIAYCTNDGSNDLGSGVKGLPFGFASPSNSSSSALQGLLNRCGIGSSNNCDPRCKTRFGLPNHPTLPSHISQKIKNLDEILQNLDHYSISKRLSSTARKDLGKNWKKWYEDEGPQQKSSFLVQDGESEHDSMSNPNVGSGLSALRGLEIPDGITHVNKSLSRMEFKTQMEKLTSLIEERWPKPKKKPLRNLERDKGSRSCLHTQAVPSPSLITNAQDNEQVGEECPSLPKPINVSEQNNVNNSTFKWMQKMMKKVIAIEHLFARRDHRSRSRQANHREILSKGRLWIHRPLGKRMFAMFQKQLKRHVFAINQRLDKTDLVIKSLRRQRHKTPSPILMDTTLNIQKQNKRTTPSLSQSSSCNNLCNDHHHGRISHHDANSKGFILTKDKILWETSISEESKQPNIAEKCMLVCDALSQDIQDIQDQLCTLQNNSQHMGQTLETIKKHSSEQSVEIELCWTAINHLCIDNETCRDELHTFQAGMQDNMQQQLQGLSPFRGDPMENDGCC